MTTWFALTASPQKEFVASVLLRKRGWKARVPSEVVRFRASRHSRRKIEYDRPIIRGYVFIGCQGQLPLWELRELSCIHCYRSGSDGVPAQVPERWLDELDELGRELSSEKPRRHIRAGDRVAITHGPLTGSVAIVHEVRNCRAKLLMQWLGSTREVEIRIDGLQVAA